MFLYINLGSVMSTKILILTLLISILSIMIGCSGTKSYEQTTGEEEFETPFNSAEYQSDNEFFRAKQSGKSPDLATSKKIALQNAKSEIAGKIQTTIKNVTDQYTNQRSIGNKQEYENKFEELAREVVNQELVDVKIMEEKTFKAQDGGYTYWIAIEISKDAILNGINSGISERKKLKLDFDKQQFEKIFNEEMKKFENEKQ